jgi:type I restriction enzyme S subunit
MSKLDELIQELCPDGVEYKSIKDVYQRLKGTPITAAKMKEIEKVGGDIRIFAELTADRNSMSIIETSS